MNISVRRLCSGPRIFSRGARCCFSTTSLWKSKLRVLFCGSDDFSIHSLRAIVPLTSLIESIDVVCRPGKPVGRGRKQIRHPQLYEEARSLGLPVHHLDTFTGWSPPHSIDLIIAVSYGKLVPPRLLISAKYGGWNIHPSFLPDLAGAAPIHWALIHGDTHSGVTLQTLHPEHFDQGTILDQTPRPGMSLPHAQDPQALSTSIDLLGRAGGDMLARNLLAGTYTKPTTANINSHTETTPGPRKAPKIHPADSRLDLSQPSTTILARAATIGPLWDDQHWPALRRTRDAIERATHAPSTATDPAPSPTTAAPPPPPTTAGPARAHFADWTDVTASVGRDAVVALPSAAALAAAPDARAVLRLARPTAGVDAGAVDAVLVRADTLGLGGDQFAVRAGDGRWLAPGRVKVPGWGWKAVDDLVQEPARRMRGLLRTAGL